jgi:AcrR family transcriptional regulator
MGVTTEAMAMTAKQTKHMGRQRSVAAEAAILTAASELIEEKPLRAYGKDERAAGFIPAGTSPAARPAAFLPNALSEVTAEAIAQRAGVSKATIYKWWPNKNRVALDAFLSRSRAEIPSSDTGSALRDLTEQLVAAARFYQSAGDRVVRQFIAEGQSDPELLTMFRERFLHPRRQAVRELWERGVARGEIRPDLDADLAIDLLFGPLFYRLLVGHGALDDADAEALAAAVFRGLPVAPSREAQRKGRR